MSRFREAVILLTSQQSHWRNVFDTNRIANNAHRDSHSISTGQILPWPLVAHVIARRRVHEYLSKWPCLCMRVCGTQFWRFSLRVICHKMFTTTTVTANGYERRITWIHHSNAFMFDLYTYLDEYIQFRKMLLPHNIVNLILYWVEHPPSFDFTSAHIYTCYSQYVHIQRTYVILAWYKCI